MKPTKVKPIIIAIFQIMGYSIAGIFSIIYGIFLQNYNSHGKLLYELENYSPVFKQLVLLYIMQILFTIMFSYKYVTVFFSSDDNDEIKTIKTKTFQSVGKWIEIIYVCYIIALIILQILFPEYLTWPNFFLTGVISILPLVICSLYYYIVTYTHKDYVKEEAKYVLVVPAVVLIGSNICAGAGMYDMLSGNYWYCIPIILIILFTFIFYVKKGIYTKIFYFAAIVILLISGITGLIITSEYYDLGTALKTLFLAIAISVFLSVFESWYIFCRQSENESKSYITVVTWIIVLEPTIIYILYPFQSFNYIYIYTCSLGILVTNALWYIYMLPRINGANATVNKKFISFLRTILVIATLSFLTLDKCFPSLFEWHIGKLYDKIFPFGLIFLSLLSCQPLANPIKKVPVWYKNDTSNHYILLQLITYPIGLLIMYFMPDLTPVKKYDVKYNMSLFFYSLFLTADICFTIYNIVIYYKNDNDVTTNSTDDSITNTINTAGNNNNKIDVSKEQKTLE